MDQITASRHADRIRELDDSWVAAVRSRDLEGMMAIYTPDAQELLAGRPAILGRDAIREFYRELLETLPRFSHQFDLQEITIAESGDLAVVRGAYRFTADDQRPDEVQLGKFVGVWVYLGGDWRLQVNISNSDA